jgi:hypothetical protein
MRYIYGPAAEETKKYVFEQTQLKAVYNGRSEKSLANSDPLRYKLPGV